MIALSIKGNLTESILGQIVLRKLKIKEGVLNMGIEMQKDRVLYHVRLNREMLSGADTAVLPGDPGRVEKTARMIDPDAVFLISNREYSSWLAELGGKKVLVCSTGIGGPSVSICVEEARRPWVSGTFSGLERPEPYRTI